MTHAKKLKRICQLLDSPEVIELHTLIDETSEYERKHYPVPLPTIPEAMKFRRDQMGENQREISLRAGMSMNRWKLIESGKFNPKIEDARKLYSVGIPADVLLQTNQQP